MKSVAIISVFALLSVVFVSAAPKEFTENCGPEGCGLNAHQYQQRPSGYPSKLIYE